MFSIHHAPCTPYLAYSRCRGGGNPPRFWSIVVVNVRSSAWKHACGLPIHSRLQFRASRAKKSSPCFTSPERMRKGRRPHYRSYRQKLKQAARLQCLQLWSLSSEIAACFRAAARVVSTHQLTPHHQQTTPVAPGNMRKQTQERGVSPIPHYGSYCSRRLPRGRSGREGAGRWLGGPPLLRKPWLLLLSRGPRVARSARGWKVSQRDSRLGCWLVSQLVVVVCRTLRCGAFTAEVWTPRLATEVIKLKIRKKVSSVETVC